MKLELSPFNADLKTWYDKRALNRLATTNAKVSDHTACLGHRQILPSFIHNSTL
jgi:hypothetical protein